MKEDLNMFGNERKLLRVSISGANIRVLTLTLFLGTSIWTVGYVIGQLPSNLLLTRVSPRWVIPLLHVGWDIATIATSAVKSYKALYALRFLVGLFE